MSAKKKKPTEIAPQQPKPELPPMRRRGRSAIVVVMLLSLLMSGMVQRWAFSYRAAALARGTPQGAVATSRLANLDSFSLGLFLGGLRGPLVMFLWTSSESQKSEKDLDSFDTKVELIRLLQPEFDSVHLFQMWNKGYNISAQLASLANKYATILDAIEYGRRVEASRLDNINIVSAIGGLYTEKLGNSAEKEYYRRRVRTETLPVYRVTFPSTALPAFQKAAGDTGLDLANIRVTEGPDGNSTAILEKPAGDRLLALFKAPGISATPVPRQSLRAASKTGRRFDMDTMLDVNGMILPQYLAPLHAVTPGAAENDGSELQYLAQFQPYPYGISPLAFGYAYYKRSQTLVRGGQQKHLNLSEMVTDSQPAHALRMWAEDELDRGRQLEAAALPPRENADALPRDLRTSKVGLDAAISDRLSIDEAIFSYERAAQVADAAIAEFVRHIQLYPNKLQNSQSHIDGLRALAYMGKADAAYLRAMVSPADQRAPLLARAKSDYIEAARWSLLQLLKYFVEDADAADVKYSRSDIDNKTLDELRSYYEQLRVRLLAKYGNNAAIPHFGDFADFERPLERASDRLKLLK